jgi:hypothetical protein
MKLGAFANVYPLLSGAACTLVFRQVGGLASAMPYWTPPPLYFGNVMPTFNGVILEPAKS